MSNFDFLDKAYPQLAKLGMFAESYLYSDTNTCLIKLGMLAESLTLLMFRLNNLELPEENTASNRIRMLNKKDFLPEQINNIFYYLRKHRNDAVHDNYENLERTKVLLEMAHTLSAWFMRTYSNIEAIPKFKLPEENKFSYTHIPFEPKTFEQDLSKEVEQTQADNISPEERIKKAYKANSALELSEKETRALIDEQLRQAGWEADTNVLRYSKGTRPEKGRNIAIAEWETNSDIKKSGGFVDYALFVGLKLLAIVEAKKLNLDVLSVLSVQCPDYAKNIKEEHKEYQVGSWEKSKVPFVFASNGRPYIEQFKEKSGVWFRDMRKNTNLPKALKGWPSPEGLLHLFESDIDATNQDLQNLSKDLLTDKDGLNLRYYQVEAVESVENAIIEGSQTALLAMATGTGKTRTVLGMIYRFLKTKRFNRILFLVDRNTLGEQAQDVFKDVKIEDALTLAQIYDSAKLRDKDIESDTKFQVATVQSMVRRLMFSDENKPNISDYDLIIIDEAHRGYTLDREMTEDEYTYRDQHDFISTYRTVMEYFDATKIAITATPAKHTTDIFGEPVYTYRYRQAVVDGYLVDHDAPHHIETKLSKEGIKYHKGDTLTLYDPITGEVTNSSALDDELNFDIDTFNNKVITEDFNKTVLAEIARNINPQSEAKTLIFAANDQHADMIVRLLQEIYVEDDVPTEAIAKITAKVGDRDRINELIRRYKNEQYPNIAVTVDLLTTGVDVPAISNLVFMRRVKSRILYEQMLGRATRLCPDINKTHFEIYDPVGLYDSLQPVNTMKPVVVNQNISFKEILDSINTSTDDNQSQFYIDLLFAKVQRKVRTIKDEERKTFEESIGNMKLNEFVQNTRAKTVAEAKDYIATNAKSFLYLASIRREIGTSIIISDKEDTLLDHSRSYGDYQRPEEYLDEFKKYILDNKEKNEAIKLICTKPKDLTIEVLKSLQVELAQYQFTENILNSAWNSMKSEDIVADIISFIRALALGKDLQGHDERINKAIKKLIASHNFTKIQIDALRKIGKFLLADTLFNEETFNRGQLKEDGGFKKFNKIFDDKLPIYIKELNTYLYDDEGDVA